MSRDELPTNRYLATGRWVTVVFGAVLAGAVTALGLAVPSHPRNLALAIVGGSVALVASGTVFVLGVRIQLAGFSLSELTARQSEVEARADVTLPAEDGPRWQAVAAADAGGVLEHLWLNGLPAPGKLHEKMASGGQDDAVRSQLPLMLAVAELWDARRRFRPLVIAAYVALPVTLVALVVGAWAWHDDPRLPDAPRLDHPVAVSVRLAKDPGALGLPEACVRDGHVAGVAVDGTWDEPVVLVEPGAGCGPAVLRVTDDVGDAVPLSP